MRQRITCPNGRYDRDMMIRCALDGGLCAHSRWCSGKGWAVLTEGAESCPGRLPREEEPKKKGRTKRGKTDT